MPKAAIIAGRVNNPTALRRSAAFQIVCSHAIAVGGSGCMPVVSKSQIGIQKTREYAPHGEKSCGSCQRSSEPKNSTRQTPSVSGGAGANQNACHRAAIAFTA